MFPLPVALSLSIDPGKALSGVLSFRRIRSGGTNSSSSSPSGGVTWIEMLLFS